MFLSILDYLFARKIFYKFNLICLKLFIRFIGFNHHKNIQKSGEINFLKHVCSQKPNFCIDIGANEGKYSEHILENSNATVLAFEPLSKNFKKLRILKRKFPKRLFIFKIGLSNKKTKLKIYFNKKNSHWANFDAEINKIDYLKENKSKEICNLNKLDNIFRRSKKIVNKSIDLIKIDTEGHELEVLLGASKTIKKFKPNYIQIEYNWHHLIKNVNLYHFSKLLKNYEVFKILPNDEDLMKIDPLRPEHNYFNFSNIVFKKKKNK